MKKGISLVILLFATIVYESNLVNAEVNNQTIPVYRLYHDGMKEHLYTSDKNEYSVLGKKGWKQEGINWYSGTSGITVNRLYSKITKKHLYTSDQNEVNRLLATKAWTKDGVVFKSSGNFPIYRLYNSNLKTHLLTSDLNEYESLSYVGWKQEGIAIKAQSLTQNSVSLQESKQTDIYKSWPDFTKNRTVLNQNRIEAKIYKQSDLNSYLLKTGTDFTGDKVWFYNTEPVKFPKATYKADVGYVDLYLPSAKGSIDFNHSKFLIGDASVAVRSVGDNGNRSFKNLSVLGSSVVSSNYIFGNWVNPITKTNRGSMYFQLLHTSNLKLENLKFEQAQPPDGHVFDVVGSENIVFDRMTIAGSYLSKNISQFELVRMIKDEPHTIFSESIQIDSSNPGSLGANFDPKTKSYLSIWWNEKMIGRTSKNITIQNSRFTGYSGNTGFGILRGVSQNVDTYGSSIGSHSVGTTPYIEILLKNLYFEDSVYVDGWHDNPLAPVHFMIVPQHLVQGLSGNARRSAIRNSLYYQNTRITFNNLQFNNKQKVYWNPSGIKTDKSTYLIAY